MGGHVAQELHLEERHYACEEDDDPRDEKPLADARTPQSRYQGRSQSSPCHDAKRQAQSPDRGLAEFVQAVARYADVLERVRHEPGGARDHPFPAEVRHVLPIVDQRVRLQHDEGEEGNAEREQGGAYQGLYERPAPLAALPLPPQECSVGEGDRREYRQAAAPEREGHPDDEAENGVVAEASALQHVQHPPESDQRQQHHERLRTIEVCDLDVEDGEGPERSSEQARAVPEEPPSQEEQQHD